VENNDQVCSGFEIAPSGSSHECSCSSGGRVRESGPGRAGAVAVGAGFSSARLGAVRQFGPVGAAPFAARSSLVGSGFRHLHQGDRARVVSCCR
jgi:hypothetical protein